MWPADLETVLVRLPRIIRTTNAKLISLYVLIFGVSVLALASVTYFVATTALDQQIRARIKVESQALQDEYRSGGLHQLLDAVAERRRGRLRDGLVYTIFDGHSHRLFGTLPISGTGLGWSEVRGPPDGDEPQGQSEKLSVLGARLPGDERVLVADDIGRVTVLGDAILRAFGFVLALSVTVAIIGGMVLSAGFLRQIHAISSTAEAVIAGEMGRRVPQRRSGDELDRLAGTINRMLDRIANLMGSLHQVSNDIAHDLRTPLGKLHQTLEEVRRHPRAATDYEQAIDHAIKECDVILGIFGALLRIAQIEAGARRSAFDRVNLSQLVESIAETYGPIAEDSGKILFKSSTPDVFAEGDRSLLTQMLVNLVENAIAHTPVGTTITLSLARNEAGAILRVADNGLGVPVDEVARIFERFYRREASRTTPGNGLGLSMVDAIASLHNLRLDVSDNRPGLCVSMQFSAAAPRATNATSSISQ